jgi:hypothetical protein
MLAISADMAIWTVITVQKPGMGGIAPKCNARPSKTDETEVKIGAME